MIIVHMIKTYFKLVKASASTFGILSADFAKTLGVPFYLMFTHLCLFLDNIFFPGYKKVEIKNPIFIIGHPRSGTTFFHRLMLKTDEFNSFKAWHLQFPSLTARKLMKGNVERRIKNGKHVMFPPETGHHTRLDTVEEEEQLFLHMTDSQFVSIIFSLAFYSGDFDELLYNDSQAHRKASIRHFKNCLKRHIYYTGKTQVMARCNFSAMRIKTLAEAFPDAKFVYIYRSPLETIPSHLSLNYHVFDYKWGLDNIGEESMMRYFDRRYRYNVEFYKYMENIVGNTDLLKDRVIDIFYDDFLFNFEPTIKRVREFMGIEFSEEMEKVIEEQAEKQKSYKRKHKNYDLEKFGIKEERLRKDLDFMFEKVEKKRAELAK